MVRFLADGRAVSAKAIDAKRLRSIEPPNSADVCVASSLESNATLSTVVAVVGTKGGTGVEQ